ncbi:hypothetical protein BGX34_003194 [Mortierella sp. NVP85]|nr:hypothetical protein BGX34_003194 [Mortierella sp. NVP85]
MIWKERDLGSGIIEGGPVEYWSYMDSFCGHSDPKGTDPVANRERECKGHESARHRMMMSLRDAIRAEAEAVVPEVGAKLRAVRSVIPKPLRDLDHEPDLAEGKRKRKLPAFYDIDVDSADE